MECVSSQDGDRAVCTRDTQNRRDLRSAPPMFRHFAARGRDRTRVSVKTSAALTTSGVGETLSRCFLSPGFLGFRPSSCRQSLSRPGWKIEEAMVSLPTLRSHGHPGVRTFCSLAMHEWQQIGDGQWRVLCLLILVRCCILLRSCLFLIRSRLSRGRISGFLFTIIFLRLGTFLLGRGFGRVFDDCLKHSPSVLKLKFK